VNDLMGPITDDELRDVEDAVKQGGSLGLYRVDREKYLAASLLEKVLAEFKALREQEGAAP